MNPTLNRFLAWLRPSTTGAIVFVVMVALQSCLGAGGGTGMVGSGGTYETTSWRSMGRPSSVVITDTMVGGATRTRVDVHWATLIFMAGLTYVLTMATGHLAQRRRRRWHPAAILLAAIGGTSILAFLAAIGVSKALWGYYLHRPALDRRIVDARKVLSVTVVQTEADGTDRRLVRDVSSSIADRIEYSRSDDYYNLGERALISLKDRGRLPDSPPAMNPERLARLYDVIARTGRLEIGESGYEEHARDLRGVLIEAEGPGGESLVFAGVQGGQVSNDHYPYYEFLFSGPDAAGNLDLISTQRFYFDVAGIEGMEWPVILGGFSALGLAVMVPVTIILLAAWPARSGSAAGTPAASVAMDSEGAEGPNASP